MWTSYVTICIQRHNVWVVYVKQHLFLRMKVHELVLLQDLSLSHDLEGVHFGLALESNQLDPSKSAIAEGAYNL